jgi:hypothetical protein
MSGENFDDVKKFCVYLCLLKNGLVPLGIFENERRLVVRAAFYLIDHATRNKEIAAVISVRDI